MLFTAQQLKTLNNLKPDPRPKMSFEILSGGLVWSDEAPKWMPGNDEDPINATIPFKYIIAYRASLTLGEERKGLRKYWNQLTEHAPKWPGLLPERRNEEAKEKLMKWLIAVEDM